MRNIWKVALASAVALVLGALAQAQPVIVGNTAAFGCGPIMTSDFSAGRGDASVLSRRGGRTSQLPHDGPINLHNGRGMALGGGGGIFRLFYTELDEIPGVGGQSGFGPSEFIHVADFNNGDGSGDIALFPNPRPGSGIQDLTIANGDLYVLTGYDTQVPQVFVLNAFTGAVKSGPIEIPRVGFTDDSVDGFAVLPNGNFLMNNSATSCIYAEYDKTDGHFIGNIINVPGGPARCTGVDTDGTSLYFMVDFTAIQRTDFAGNPTGFNFFDGPGGEDFIEDISLIHPLTVITDVGDGHMWLGLRNQDDQNTHFDFQVEILKNGVLIPGAVGLTQCVGGPGSPYDELTRNPSKAVDVTVAVPAFPPASIDPGDVLSARISTRIGTDPDGVHRNVCTGHVSALGVKLYYDASTRASNIPMTIAPNPELKYYLRSDGNPCPDGSSGGSAGVTARVLDTTTPGGVSYKCKESPGVSFNILTLANPWAEIGTWSLAPF